ncbi:MAG: galactose mutarotase [Planctomycetales bacterium]|nr:galactose mutarotase [Planctomycetales bacterium]
MSIQRSEFGKTSSGESVSLFILTNCHHQRVTITDYGAILVTVEVADRNGQVENVNLGYNDLSRYLERHPYLGSTVGRFCNRIARGKFQLDGHEYSLVINNGPNHLHGGTIGFDKQIWTSQTFEEQDHSGVRFALTSPDGQEGYPGTLQISAEYRWTDSNELVYQFRAVVLDKPTVLNLTNHAYWNLKGLNQGDVLDHELQLSCDHYVAVDETLIPTGEIADVRGTALDFREPHLIGERILELPATKGYDHCFVVNGQSGQLRTCAVAKNVASGRVMEVLTTQPGVQLYTGNHLGGGFSPHSGFCLETQHFPDSPNKPQFPSTRLNPGEEFSETTIHRFSVME